MACTVCGDSFERTHRTGRRPELRPDCRRIRNEERSHRRFAEAQALKRAGRPVEVRRQDCGKAIEGYRRGQRGGVPKFCRTHSLERRGA